MTPRQRGCSADRRNRSQRSPGSRLQAPGSGDRFFVRRRPRDAGEHRACQQRALVIVPLPSPGWDESGGWHQFRAGAAVYSRGNILPARRGKRGQLLAGRQEAAFHPRRMPAADRPPLVGPDDDIVAVDRRSIGTNERRLRWRACAGRGRTCSVPRRRCSRRPRRRNDVYLMDLLVPQGLRRRPGSRTRRPTRLRPPKSLIFAAHGASPAAAPAIRSAARTRSARRMGTSSLTGRAPAT